MTDFGDTDPLIEHGDDDDDEGATTLSNLQLLVLQEKKFL